MQLAVLVLHLLGAAVWTGGHLVLALSVLPRALARRDASLVQQYEELYERIGVPALVIQVATGIWLALQHVPFARWLAFGNALERQVGLKLVLLALTLVLALHARLRIVPKLHADKLRFLALHIAIVSALAVGLVLVGAGFRIGGFF